MEVLIISKTNDAFLNEEIRDKEVRLVGSDGSQLGIVSAKEALKIAVEQGLDLVKIAPNATPPVCKVMDYGKYRYEQAKREKEARKNQKIVEIKEVRMSLNIDIHDFETKINQAKKFLKGGDKVKVSVRYRGRELAHPEMGNDLLERFKQACADDGAVEKPAKFEGRSLAMFIAPKLAK
ncbi:MAG: translation initiation factor IF-3 [Oscillospiraceae bacterium]